MHVSVHIVPGASVPALAVATHLSGWHVAIGAQSESFVHGSSESTGAFTAPSENTPALPSEEASDDAEALDAETIVTVVEEALGPPPPFLGGAPSFGQASGPKASKRYTAPTPAFRPTTPDSRRAFIDP